MISKFDGVICDLDGVVWTGDEAIAGAADAVTRLRRAGVRIVFVTNDPRSDAAYFQARLRRMGIDAAKREILTVARAAAEAVRKGEEPGARVLVIGTPALRRQVQSAGLEVVEPGSGAAIGAVVVGGHDDFHYRELQAAVRALRAGATLYAAGRDRVFPAADGPAPATGAIVAAIEWSSGVEARVIGKPHSPLFEAALAELEGRQRVIVIGDTLESDIAGAHRLGLPAVLVLSGNTSAAELASSNVRPDLVIGSLAELERH